jgi:hypothetical protein
MRQSSLLLVGADGFRSLTSFILNSYSQGHIVFQPGAMPKVETVDVHINVQVAKEKVAGVGGDCIGLGIENLQSLCQVILTIHRSGVTVGEAKQAYHEVRPDIPRGT